MKRRHFIKTTSAAAVAVPFVLNGMPLNAFEKSGMYASLDNNNDRILVLIQLNGGNDGLNTVIPIDQYTKLSDARSNIILPENSILKLTDKTGIHPSMTGLKSLFDNAKLNVVQNVGYPDQNRSHFRSTDIWTSASSAEEVITTGWLGRYFGSKYPDYPAGYPNTECTDPFAITVGSLVSETCQGTSANFSLAILDPTSLFQLNEGSGGNPDLNTCYGMELSFLRSSLLQTNAYINVINAANTSGTNLSTYPKPNSLADQLKVVARLIAGGLKTKVYITSLGGFDTHAKQVDTSDTTMGSHANLLQQVSDAVKAFQDDLTAHGLEEKVIGMTFSEFGRQIKSNDSDGTDHGTAAPLFLFGSCVKAGVFGNNPVIPTNIADQEGVAMDVDFRSVYGTIMKDWFNMDTAEIDKILFDKWQYLALLKDCTTAAFDPALPVLEAKLYPNPVVNVGSIEFSTEDEWARISIFNALGFEIKLLSEQRFIKGQHKISFRLDGFPAANYYVRIQTKRVSTTKAFVKI